MSTASDHIATQARSFVPQLECVPCFVRQAREAISQTGVDATAGFQVLRHVLQLLSREDLSVPPPLIGKKVHRLIRRLTLCSDPYAGLKTRMNEQAARQYLTWHRRFREAYSPLEAAVRLAIVGNLFDVGAKTRLDPSGVRLAFEAALTAPLRGSVEALADAIQRSRSILYLADNAGEIVFDRDLLAQLPIGSLTVAVRGFPVLNDATMADAEQAGVTEFCEVISNGSDAPGTILTDCSQEFRECFEAADLVLSKGQGNFETLSGVNKNVFFLLNIKCEVLSRVFGWPTGSLVIHHHPFGVPPRLPGQGGSEAPGPSERTDVSIRAGL